VFHGGKDFEKAMEKKGTRMISLGRLKGAALSVKKLRKFSEADVLRKKEKPLVVKAYFPDHSPELPGEGRNGKKDTFSARHMELGG